VLRLVARQAQAPVEYILFLFSVRIRASCNVFVRPIRIEFQDNERTRNMKAAIDPKSKTPRAGGPARAPECESSRQSQSTLKSQQLDGLGMAAADAPISDEVDRYLDEIQSAIAAIDRDAVRRVVDALEAVWVRMGTTFLIGNGGSASTASHMMNDLNKFTALPGTVRFRALALTDNVPLITALANDLTFADIFVEPLQNFARPGDALIAISGSGNSPNIIRAVEYALRYGITTIGLCGSPGGRLAAISDHHVIVPAQCIGQQEDGHLVLNHTIATALRERIERSKAPSALISVVR
jgi:D-sedoheptulose 7-phosphate isomerase